jgi:hypothetical protein
MKPQIRLGHVFSLGFTSTRSSKIGACRYGLLTCFNTQCFHPRIYIIAVVLIRRLLHGNLLQNRFEMLVEMVLPLELKSLKKKRGTGTFE